MQLRLTNLVGYSNHINWKRPSLTVQKAEELLSGVTWHIFIDDREVVTSKFGNDATLQTYMCCALLRVYSGDISKGFYRLNENRSSHALAPDIYIYLDSIGEIPDNFKGISDTLCFHEGVKVWTPKRNMAPYIDYKNQFCTPKDAMSETKLQKLYTSQNSSLDADSTGRIVYRRISYRGNRAKRPLTQYGTYRYRLIGDRIKTQWYTVNIMSDGRGEDRLVIKK